MLETPESGGEGQFSESCRGCCGECMRNPNTGRIFQVVVASPWVSPTKPHCQIIPTLVKSFHHSMQHGAAKSRGSEISRESRYRGRKISWLRGYIRSTNYRRGWKPSPRGCTRIKKGLCEGFIPSTILTNQSSSPTQPSDHHAPQTHHHA